MRPTPLRDSSRLFEFLPLLLLLVLGAALVRGQSAPILLVQHVGKDAGTATSSTLGFTASNTAGNWIAVAIRAWRAGPTLNVTDTGGNIYRLAIRFDETVDGMTLGIFYAENIAGGSNTVTVSGVQSGGTLRFAIFEYSGVATAGSLDVTAGSQGTSTSPSSGSATTTTSGDLVIGLLSTANVRTFTAGSGYVIQERVPAPPNTKLVGEDRIQATPGPVSANGTLDSSDIWAAAMATFRPASAGSPSPNITSVSPASGVVGTSVTIGGTNFGAAQGVGTVRFNGATATPTSWSATSVVAPVPAGATTGPIVVTVNGTASNGVTFTVTPSDTQPPTAPGNLTATAAGQDRIDLTWAASTDNLGVTNYRVEQCQGSGCTNFTEIAQVTAGSTGMGPLTASANPNYFKDAGGNPVILNGSHTWNTLQDWGANGSLQTLDFDAFVSTLVANGHNFTFLWYIELPKFCGLPTTTGTPPDFTVGPHPWQRTGPGTATDGGLKFDLTKYNQAYFDRLRTRVEALKNAGIYVGVYTFTAEWVGRYRCSTDGYPFTGVNNINAINDGGGANSFTMSSPNAITAIQDAYVEKVIDTLNDLPNVLWMVSEEAPPNSNWWNDHQIAHIRSYESGQPYQHPIGYATQTDLSDATVMNSDADWIAGGSWLAPTTSCGSGTPPCKVNVNDSDHSYWEMWTGSAQTNRSFAWENFMNGNHVAFMDPYVVYYPRQGRNLCPSPINGICSSPDPRWNNFRANLGYILTYSRKLNLASVTPRGSLCSTGFCLAQIPSVGAEYLIYAPNGGAFTVNLSAMSSARTLNVEWFNPATGATTTGTPIPAGSSSRSFTPPFSGDAVLYLVDSAGHAGTPASPPQTSYTVTGLGAGTYRYRVLATDAAGNPSPYSNIATATTQPAPAGISLVQHANKDTGGVTASTLAFTSNNVAGNWIAVAIRAWQAGPTLTVTDTRGNTYRSAIRFNETVDGMTLGVFYAENIAGGANTVTVSGNQSGGTLRFAILEYSGVATVGSLDVTAAAQGTSAAPNSGSATTTSSGGLLIGLISTANGRTYTAGTGFVIQDSVPAAPATKAIVEDRRQATAGVASAGASLNSSDIWAAVMAAFRPDSGGPPLSPSPDVTLTKSHTGTFTQGQDDATYALTVSNSGAGPTSGQVTVTDSLPAGLTATALSGPSWNCALATLSCTRSDALQAAAAYPPITLTVKVSANAPASVTNVASVAGGGDANASNNSASDVTAIAASAPPGSSGSFQNETLISGMNLPVAVKFLPNGDMLILELGGKIWRVPAGTTQVSTTPFLSLTNIGSVNGQQGLMDLVLDPSFSTNRYYYVFYTLGTPNRDRVSRFTATADSLGTVAGSETVVYQDPQDAHAEHHGGALNFGNDGKLYITTGEHFNPPNAQSLTSPRGKILRINPDGTIPTDNPFHDGAGPNRDDIWALGLRNPFRAFFDSPSGKLYVADVGGNDFSTAQEEVNLAVRGANYGWPNCEGSSCGSNPAYTSPIYSYPHNGRDASITGGFIYRGSQFPAEYIGNYFFADYAQNWIRRLTFNANGTVSGVFNFEPPDGVPDGPYGDIVYLTQGPDGALYYVDLGFSDITGQSGISRIRRIRFVWDNEPPTATASASPVQGPAPLTVNFSSAGSADPEGQPLTYLWNFGDGATSTQANASHTYTQTGQYTVQLTVSDGRVNSSSAPLMIAVGNRPVPDISSPADGLFFRGGDSIAVTGEATDIEDGDLPAGAFTWTVDFLHAGHVHPGLPTVGTKSFVFDVPATGHDFSGDTRYRITLSVTDSDGLEASQFVTIYPDKVSLDFTSAPSGLVINVDGLPHTTPFVYDTMVNFTHTIHAPNQTVGQTAYTFASWSDGGAQTHTLTVPAARQSYIANYSVGPVPFPPGLVAGYRLDQTTGTTAPDISGNNTTGTLVNAPAWTVGRYGNALSFSGSNYVNLGNPTTLRLTGSMTLSAWINISTNPFDDAAIAGKLAEAGWQLKTSPDTGMRTAAVQISSNGSNSIQRYSSTVLAANTWYHIAGVYDAAARTLNLYVNGVLDNGVLSGTVPAAQTDANVDVNIAQRTGMPGTLNFQGRIDEVHIFNRALSASEIQNDMNVPR